VCSSDLSWGKATGSDYDLSIGENNLLDTVERAVDKSEACDEAVIAQLGDFLHLDDAKNATPGSGHQLDVDGRFEKVVEVAVRSLRYCVNIALQKHKRVRLVVKPGNHDPSSTALLRAAMKGYFDQEPRLIVDDCYMPISTVEFGQVLLGFTHGHGPKPVRMVPTLAVDYREEWGRCAFRYIHHGHLHNRRVFEEQECLVECHRALTSRDQWTSEMGFRSGRDMQTIMYDRELGEADRSTTPVIARIRNDGP